MSIKKALIALGIFLTLQNSTDVFVIELLMFYCTVNKKIIKLKGELDDII